MKQVYQMKETISMNNQEYEYNPIDFGKSPNYPKINQKFKMICT